MLQIAVCDDEQFYRKKIKMLLERFLTERECSYVVETFPSGEAFLCCGENAVKYDIVFLDISMEELDGIQTAMRIRAFRSDTYIVLVTSHISYVLEGYKVDAVRYIMKDTLDAAVPECMHAIMQKMRAARVTFPFTGGERSLYADNILYIESQRHRSVFRYMEAGPVCYQIYEKLDEIEMRLREYEFLRIHKSYLVNLKHIQKISNYKVYLDTGEELPVPRSKYRSVKETYVAYKGAYGW